MQVLNHRIEIKAFECLSIVEPLAHRIGQTGIAVKNRDIQGVRPPVAVPAAAHPGRYRALRRGRYGLGVVGLRCLFYFFLHLFVLSMNSECASGNATPTCQFLPANPRCCWPLARRPETMLSV